PRAGFAFTADEHASAGINAGGDSDIDCFVFRQRAPTVAARARRAAGFRSLSIGAGFGVSPKITPPGKLAGPRAGRARKYPRRRFARPLATRASFAPPDLDVGSQAVNRVFKVERKRELNIRAAPRLRPRLRCRAPRAAAEQITENVAKTSA